MIKPLTRREAATTARQAERAYRKLIALEPHATLDRTRRKRLHDQHRQAHDLAVFLEAKADQDPNAIS